jgi:phage terminase large subunit-like protein
VEEVLFGGAVGGGKSEALLMWLAEGVEIPGYNAVLYRRFETDTKADESALLAKSSRLYPALGGKLVGLRWKFPKGSSITLEGVAHEKSVLSAQGREFHRAAFDELTHFTEMMFNFIYTTRVRKVKGFPIKCGVAASANPGGPGHLWVSERYITKEAIKEVRAIPTNEPTPPGTVYYKSHGPGFKVAYVPSRMVDNPHLDVEDYLRRLNRNTNPVERARMMNGDWGISPEGLIKPHLLRYYTFTRGNIIALLKSVADGQGGIIHTDDHITEFDERTSRRFITVDTAGGMKDITRESKGKNPSWTVAGIWDHKRYNGGRDSALLLRHVWRARVGFTEVAHKLVSLVKEWSDTSGPGSVKVSRVRVEDKTMGPDLVNLLQGIIPIDLIATGTLDKVARATTLLNMMEKGQVYLPQGENSWRPTLEDEWLGWQGMEGETNDQVDMSAYAAIEAGGANSGVISLDWDPRKPYEVEKALTGKVWTALGS